MTFKSPIYKNTHGGKGANPRPGVYTKQYRDNWDLIFNKGSNDADKEKK